MFYRFAKLVCRVVLYTVRRWHIEGQHNLPAGGGFVLVSNHTSYWDPIVVGCALPCKIFFMAKAELFKIPLLNIIIINLGAFPIKRGQSDRNAIRRALELLKEGRVVGIFPEGTRSKTGELLEPHLGAAMLATRAGVPVVPMAVINSRGIFGKITVKIGKPIVLASSGETSKRVSKNDLIEGSNLVMKEILKLIDG